MSLYLFLYILHHLYLTRLNKMMTVDSWPDSLRFCLLFFLFYRKLGMWRTGPAVLRWIWERLPPLWSMCTKATSSLLAHRYITTYVLRLTLNLDRWNIICFMQECMNICAGEASRQGQAFFCFKEWIKIAFLSINKLQKFYIVTDKSVPLKVQFYVRLLRGFFTFMYHDCP